jgi:hypothetical protein
VPDLALDLPDGDVAPLLDHLADALYVNLRPGVDADDVPPVGGLGQLFGNRGPLVPLATWTPGEIGLQHGLAQRAAPALSDRGVPVPEDWYVVSDHPKRGVVLRTYQSPPEAALRWLVRAAGAVCPLPIVGPWQAEVRTR